MDVLWGKMFLKIRIVNGLWAIQTSSVVLNARKEVQKHTWICPGATTFNQ